MIEPPVTTPSMLSETSHAPQRIRRLAIAFGTGLASKLLAVLVQLAALPFALHALGTEKYAAFLALQALVGWSSLLGFGLAPALPRILAQASAFGDRRTQSDLLVTSAAIIAMAALVFALCLFLVAAIISPAVLVGAGTAPISELNIAFGLIVVAQAVSLALSLMPAVRAGYHELHYTYTWSALANVLVLAMLLLISYGTPTIPVFFAALSVPLLTMMVLDVGLLLWQRPFLARGRVNIALVLSELGPNARNALAAQASYFAVMSVPIVIIAHISGPTATAGFGSLTQLIMLGFNGMNLIFQPLIPAIANAYAHEDRLWIRGAYWLSVSVVGVTCFGIAVGAALGGPQIVHLWLGSDLGISHVLTGLLGLYFAVFVSSTFHLNVLTAMGQLDGVGRAYLVEGLLCIILGIVLTGTLGPEGMATALVLAGLSVTGWYMPYRTLRVLARFETLHRLDARR